MNIKEQYKLAYRLERQFAQALRMSGSARQLRLRTRNLDFLEQQLDELDTLARNAAYMSVYAAEHLEFIGWMSTSRHEDWYRARSRYNSEQALLRKTHYKLIGVI